MPDTFGRKLTDIEFYISAAAINHIRMLVEFYSTNISVNQSFIKLNMILVDEVLIIGFVPEEIIIGDEFCYKFLDYKLYIENPGDLEMRLRGMYVDEMNSCFFMRRRAPNDNSQKIVLSQFFVP